MIALVVAISENRVIGKDNQLIWHLPEDLKHFKRLTLGHPMIMGRKTFEAIGKPLPGRTSIIITRQEAYVAPGCVVVSSWEEGLKAALALDEQVMVVGGGEIYRQALPYAETIYLTLVHESFEGDTFFPDLDSEAWEVTDQQEHPADEKHAHPFSFFTFRRKAAFSPI